MFDSPVALGAALFLIGFATYTFIAANTQWMLSNCDGQEARDKSISLAYVFTNFGGGLASIIMGIFATYSFTLAYSVVGGIIVCAAIYNSCKQRAETVVCEYNDAQQGKQKERLKLTVFNILVAAFLVGLLIAQLGSMFPVFIHTTFHAGGLLGVSSLYVLNGVLIVLMQVPVSQYLKNHDKCLLMGLGSLIMGVGFVVLAIPAAYWITVVCIVLFTVGEMFYFTQSIAVCYEYGEQKGRLYGLWQAYYAAGLIIGPYLGSLVYHHLGSSTLWVICGMVGLVALLVSVKKLPTRGSTT